ncbi:protein TolR [bacterium]|jgi:biopolymer transport protein ExbD|nr:protein TolR [bacterium]MBT3903778.1 protein TolR [bacterium]MBT4578212.1 protein TolR [bacterium]MBT5345443.1 protein TolR [bacterium]MBT6131137.1 protein TolR [bacterium]
MMRRRRRARHSNNLHVEISMTPLIDTALTLLIIFMITTPMMQQMIKVELPKGSTSEITSPDLDVIVSIDKKGLLYLNGKKASDYTQLIERIKKVVGRASDRVVTVQADRSVAYGMVLELVDRIKYLGGIEYVALATERA